MKTTKSQHKYFQSKINRDFVERFIIEESIIGFDHVNFRKRILDELSYLGLELNELASKCYISTSRMSYVMNKNTQPINSNVITVSYCAFLRSFSAHGSCNSYDVIISRVTGLRQGRKF